MSCTLCKCFLLVKFRYKEGTIAGLNMETANAQDLPCALHPLAPEIDGADNALIRLIGFLEYLQMVRSHGPEMIGLGVDATYMSFTEKGGNRIARFPSNHVQQLDLRDRLGNEYRYTTNGDPDAW